MQIQHYSNNVIVFQGYATNGKCTLYHYVIGICYRKYGQIGTKRKLCYGVIKIKKTEISDRDVISGKSGNLQIKMLIYLFVIFVLSF